MKRIVVALMLAAQCFGTVPVIFDDDCTSDSDCGLSSLPAVFKLADRGEIQLLGVMADSSNSLAAPALNLIVLPGNYYKVTATGSATLTLQGWGEWE